MVREFRWTEKELGESRGGKKGIEEKQWQEIRDKEIKLPKSGLGIQVARNNGLGIRVAPKKVVQEFKWPEKVLSESK